MVAKTAGDDAMKTVGLIGGMSWESTVTYYQIINTCVKERLGGFHSAKCVLYSVDFAEIEARMARGAWDEAAKILGDAAVSLARAGADFILICTNTLHKVFDQVASRVSVPLLHIAGAAADALNARGVHTVALLGTKYTMRQDFYRERLVQRGLSVLVPDEADMDEVDRIIFDELCLGKISEESRRTYVRIIDKLAARGAQAALLGCTEIGLLVRPEDSETPLFDTAVIHARRAAELALEDEHA
jgi:aspartate racemase